LFNILKSSDEKNPRFFPACKNFQAKAKRHDFYATLTLDNLKTTLDQFKNYRP